MRKKASALQHPLRFNIHSRTHNSALTLHECFTHCSVPHCHGQTFRFKQICPIIFFLHSTGTDLVHPNLTSTKASEHQPCTICLAKQLMSPLPLPCTFHHVCTGCCSSPKPSFNHSCPGSPLGLPGHTSGLLLSLCFSVGCSVCPMPPHTPLLRRDVRYSVCPVLTHTAAALRYHCPSLSAQHSSLLETASMRIPHCIKEALGTHLKMLYICCDALCSCFLSFHPLLSVQKVWDSQPSARAVVGHCSIVCTVTPSHCRASSAKAIGKVPAHRTGDSSLGSSHSSFLLLSTAQQLTWPPHGHGIPSQLV